MACVIELIARPKRSRSAGISQHARTLAKALMCMIGGSLEVKLPTIWTDGKAEVGRVREGKGRRKKIREEKEKRERKKKEDQRREKRQKRKSQKDG